jgi:hypothetical protein
VSVLPLLSMLVRVTSNDGGDHARADAYRLAPADGPLTEATFGKMPLDFIGNSTLRWDGDRSTQISFNSAAKGWETNVGTMPPGSSWR